MASTPDHPTSPIASPGPASPSPASVPTALRTASTGLRALERRMTSRHLMMISFGGVIGTGLFLSSGYTVSRAGPVGTILAYAVGAVIVYLVMLCLGELSVAMPVSGAFHVYARRCLGPATGFVTAVLYWLTWTVALGSEFTGAAMIMTGWFPATPSWMWAAFFILLILGINLAPVRIFAEAETLLSSIKVLAIIVFVMLGGLAIIGVLPYSGYDSAPLLRNLTADGLFPNGLGAVLTTMLTVNFAFSGTELIGVTAGETKDPREAIPRAIRTTLWRLVVFFIGSITVMSALIPWREAGVEQSPFVTIFNAMGVPFTGTIMNAVILAAILSAANSGLYASTRMLWSLADEGTMPELLARTNRFGVPARAMAASMIGGLAALATSAVAASTVYIVLVSVSGLAVMLVWVSIAASHLSFRHHRHREGRDDDEFPFRAPGYPWVSLAALVASGASCVLIIFDSTQRPALWMTAVFVMACYALHWIRQGRVST